MFKYIKFKELPVTNQDRALQFYTEKLGLRVAEGAPYYQDDLRHDEVALTEHTIAKRQQPVTVIWDTWLKPGTEEEGLRLTRQVWSDMQSFDGYVSHQIFIDQGALGHIIALGKWRSRDDADAVREKYKDSETIRQLTPLLARPRDRWVAYEDESPYADASVDQAQKTALEDRAETRPGSTHGWRWIELEVADQSTRLLFSQRADENPGDTPSLNLVTDNVRDAYEKLKANGIVFTQEPTDAPWSPGHTYALFRDSENNLILIGND